MRTEQIDPKKIRYIIYCRKSSDSEDRQVASLGDQLRALKELAQYEGLVVVGKQYTESASAHELGRPDFNEMMGRIQKGEADGILVWHQNRLARNPMDGAMIVFSMDQGYLKMIKTVHTTFVNNADNKAYLGHEFVDSKKYSDNLSEVVKRGLNSKVNDKRVWPGVAKPGYLNVTDGVWKTNGIEVDPIRFPLLQKVFELVRSGNYSPLQALYYLNNELGYQTRRTRRYGDKPMSKATFYRVLSDPFYYGLIEHTQGTVMGTHTPMMTKAQFDEIQVRLGKVGKPHQTKSDFPYKEFLKCGECGGAITAQEKWQIRCLACKTKYHKKSNDPIERCLACKKEYKVKEDYQLLHYVYYGCTKKKTPGCSQGHVRLEDIEEEVDRELSQFEIRPEFRDWAIKYLNEASSKESNNHKVVLANLQSQYADMDIKINNLMEMYISFNNANKEMLSEDEYKLKRTTLLTEKTGLMDKIKQIDQDKNKWVELTEKTFDFACYARYWYAKGDSKAKSEILGTLGKNLTLKDRKLWIDRANPFYLIEKGKKEVEEIIEKLEPEKRIGLKDNFLSLEEVSNKWRRRWDSNPRDSCESKVSNLLEWPLSDSSKVIELYQGK